MQLVQRSRPFGGAAIGLGEGLEIGIFQSYGIRLNSLVDHIIADLAQSIVIPQQDYQWLRQFGSRRQFVESVLKTIVSYYCRNGTRAASEHSADGGGERETQRAETDGMNPRSRHVHVEYLVCGIGNLSHVGGNDAVARQRGTDDG